MRGITDTIEYILSKLPKETTQILLAQQSKNRLNTVRQLLSMLHESRTLTYRMEQPLHLAVKCGMKDAIRTILSFGVNPDTLLLRDSEGSTPLHVAVQRGLPEATRLLLKASPPSALHLENGVGETPLEIATLHEIVWRTRTDYKGTVVENVPELPLQERGVNGQNALPACSNLERLEVEVPKLRTTIDGLLKDGILRPGTKLTIALLAFADRMEKRLAVVRASPIEPLKDEEDEEVAEEDEAMSRITIKNETSDRKAVRDAVRDAVNAQPGLRGLVHLIDAQTAVQGQLSRVKEKPDEGQYSRSYRRRYRPNDKEGLEDEEDANQEERKNSMLFANGGYGGTISSGPDRY